VLVHPGAGLDRASGPPYVFAVFTDAKSGGQRAQCQLVTRRDGVDEDDVAHDVAAAGLDTGPGRERAHRRGHVIGRRKQPGIGTGRVQA